MFIQVYFCVMQCSYVCAGGRVCVCVMGHSMRVWRYMEMYSVYYMYMPYMGHDIAVFWHVHVMYTYMYMYMLRVWNGT